MDDVLVAGLMFVVLGVCFVVWYKPIAKVFRMTNLMSDRWASVNEMGVLIGGAAGVVMGVVLLAFGLFAN